MAIVLFSNANIINSENKPQTNMNLVIQGDKITYLSEQTPQNVEFDRVINAKDMLLIPALYNTHTHLPMALLKGIGENMMLQEWLEKKIFPAEDKLTPEMAYYGTLLAVAENIQNGIISFTDMYNFCDRIIQAISESGAKANIGRAAMSFDENEDMANNFRIIEAKKLFSEYHNSSNGRIKIDMAIHAEYTSNAKMVAYVSEFTKANNLNMHVHISETKREHEESIQRHNMTPVAYFNSMGLFDNKTTAAHCVHVTEEDMAIMAEKGVTASHCPISNLKLASGVCDIVKMREKGINVTFGTDSSASNNRQDIFEEMFVSSLLQKGVYNDPLRLSTLDLLDSATKNSAKSQGRDDCGSLEIGKKADITVLDMKSIESTPYYDFRDAMFYSMRSRSVKMTISDGKILYENGEFKTIDIEKVLGKVTETVNNNYKL